MKYYFVILILIFSLQEVARYGTRGLLTPDYVSSILFGLLVFYLPVLAWVRSYQRDKAKEAALDLADEVSQEETNHG